VQPQTTNKNTKITTASQASSITFQVKEYIILKRMKIIQGNRL